MAAAWPGPRPPARRTRRPWDRRHAAQSPSAQERRRRRRDAPHRPLRLCARYEPSLELVEARRPCSRPLSRCPRSRRPRSRRPDARAPAARTPVARTPPPLACARDPSGRAAPGVPNTHRTGCPSDRRADRLVGPLAASTCGSAGVFVEAPQPRERPRSSLPAARPATRARWWTCRRRQQRRTAAEARYAARRCGMLQARVGHPPYGCMPRRLPVATPRCTRLLTHPHWRGAPRAYAPGLKRRRPPAFCGSLGSRRAGRQGLTVGAARLYPSAPGASGPRSATRTPRWSAARRRGRTKGSTKPSAHWGEPRSCSSCWPSRCWPAPWPTPSSQAAAAAAAATAEGGGGGGGGRRARRGGGAGGGGAARGIPHGNRRGGHGRAARQLRGQRAFLEDGGVRLLRGVLQRWPLHLVSGKQLVPAL